MSGKDFHNLRSEWLPKCDAYKIKSQSLQHKTYKFHFLFVLWLLVLSTKTLSWWELRIQIVNPQELLSEITCL